MTDQPQAESLLPPRAGTSPAFIAPPVVGALRDIQQ
jgi:hypothetical protein